MPRALQASFGLVIVSLIVGGPLAYRVYVERNFRNLRVVRPGVLYRSGQLTHDGLVRVIHDHGIRTVISLRDSHTFGEVPPDWDEQLFCRKEGLFYYRMAPKSWWAVAGRAPADDNVRDFLGILDEPRHYPILVHCFAGAHRTGAYCAIYRMEHDHWDNATAMQELFAGGYKNLYEEEDIRTYLETYVPRWKQPRGTQLSEARR